MNDFDRMLHEYVVPFVFLTIMAGFILLFFHSCGNSIDKEIEMEERIKAHYIGGR